ncbi:MAG: ZPR1 zinc finger domain-containing protein [Euryarchaeota archaeon]|nr:ZPR1 zinc finger domain-containing protein [Euryarchaeota archaeon]
MFPETVKPTEVPIHCPICGKKTIKIITHAHSIPYFRKIVEITLICENCGFRHADVLIAGEREPMRYELEISSERDMLIRVIRSSSGTIRIPELGVTIEPGPRSFGFVSNVEGVLDRILNVLNMLEGSETSQEKLEKIKKLKKKIELIKEGKEKATLIIDDPTGNSAIISEKAKKRRLTEEELKSLKFGYLVLESSEV